MKSTTSTYKQIIASGDTRKFLVTINLTLADDTQITITEADIMDNSFKLLSASSGTDSFDIGSAIIGKCQFTLMNFDDSWTAYDFFNATAVVWVGMDGDVDENDNQVYYRMGFYTVDEPAFAGSLVSLELLDNMWKFDVPLSDVNLSYPITALSAVNAICSYCGVTNGTQSFHGSSFSIAQAPTEDINCREMLQYIAMIGCNFCTINSSGALDIRWYDTSANPSDELDGGTFSTNTTPYSDGDNADGGNFTNYSSGADYDGGSFIDPNVVYFTRLMSRNIGTDRLEITGVKFVIENTDYRIGQEGYVLSLENPLVDTSNVNRVLNLIWDVIEDFKIRTFNVTALPDLSPEVGDCVAVSYKGNMVYSYLTNYTFTPSLATASLGAITPTRSLTKRYSKAVKAAVEIARKNTNEIISDYDLAVQMMNNLAVNAMGAYQDYQDMPTGGRIYFLSNMPITKNPTTGVCSFESGSTVFKKSGDGFFVSTDGGQTWTNGYNAQTGNLVVNVLNAIGLSAEWIKAGELAVGGSDVGNPTILVKDVNNNPICYIDTRGLIMYAGRIESASGGWYLDASTGDVQLAGTTQVGSGGTTLNDLATKEGTIIDVDVEYAKNQSNTTAPTTGWSTTSPQWESGYYIWQRTKTTDANEQSSYSTPVCIQGAKGQDGVSINSVTITYGVSNSSSTQPSSWQSTIPVVSGGQYLWTRTVTDYTDPSIQDTVTYTYAKQGEQGQAGTSVSVSSIKYQAGTSATTPPTGTWSDNPVTVAQGQYLWTKTTFSNGSVAYGIARQGEDGDDGTGVSAIVEQYYLSTSSTTQTGGSWSTAQPAWVEGKYIWTRSAVTWTNGSTTYTEPVLAKAINGANQAVQDLDDSLDQEEVFNRLIGGDTNQGLKLENGKLYLRGEWFSAGAITVGGSAYANNPTLVVKDTGNHEVIKLNVDGLYAIAGQIGGSYLDNNEIYNIGTYIINSKTLRLSENSSVYYLVCYIRPSELYITEDSFKVSVAWEFSDSSRKRGFKAILEYLGNQWTSAGEVTIYNADASLIPTSGTQEINATINKSDTRLWRLRVQTYGVASNIYNVTVSATIANVHVSSMTAKGFLGTHKGFFEGIGAFYEDTTIGNFSFDDTYYLKYENDNGKTIILNPAMLNFQNSSTEYGKLEINNPKLRIQDSSTEYIEHSTSRVACYTSSSQYVLASTTPSLILQNSSNVYIKATSTSIECKGSSSYVKMDSNEEARITAHYSGSRYIDITSDSLTLYKSSQNYAVFSNSQLAAKNNGSSYYIDWAQGSDRRIKDEIEPLDVELSRNLIDATKTKKFKYKSDKSGKHYGMIAQEARELLDSLGEEDAVLEYAPNVEDDNIPNYRAIHYEEYIPHLINYVKDLRAELNRVKTELDRVKTELKED